MNPGTLAGWLSAHRKTLILGAVTLVAYAAAINRTQALLWGLCALFSATLIAGFAWPRWLVKQLDVTRSGPARAQAGETITFRVAVHNRGALPRFMVELVDRLPFVDVSQPGARSADTVLGVLAYLPARRTSHFDVPVLCEKRGHYRLGPVGLASSFPLGLAEARRTRNDGVQTLTIYPEVFNILSLPLRGAPSLIHRGGYVLPEGAGAAEFCGLREYRRGDNPRHVHWPTTARFNELMVREYEPLASACLYLALDQAAESNVGHGKEASFEYAVRIAASIARGACMQGIRTRIAGDGARALRGVSGAGDAHYQEILDAFAVVDCDGAVPYGQLLTEIATTCIRGETVVVFLSQRPARTAETLQALHLLKARQAHVFAVVFDRDSFLPETAAPADAPDQTVLVAALMDMGAHLVPVRKGDDLLSLFNP